VIMALTVDKVPRTIFDPGFEFSRNGPGVQDAGQGGCSVIDLGFNRVEGQLLRQYKFTEDVSNFDVEGLVKHKFRHVTLDSDYVYPSHIGALKYALIAICYENEGAIGPAAQYWEKCYEFLEHEKATSNIGVTRTLPQDPWGLGASKPSSMM